MEVTNCAEVSLKNSSWKGPMEASRKKTDPEALKFYLLFLITWVGIGICVISFTVWFHPKQQTIKNHGQSKESELLNWTSIFDSESSTEISDFILIFAQLPSQLFHITIYNHVAFLAILGCSILTLVLSIIFLILVRLFVKFIAWGTFVVYCIFLSIMIFIFNSEGSHTLEIAFIAKFIVTVIFVLTFCRQIQISCEIIRMTSKTIFLSGHHFAVSLGQFFLSFTAILFFANNTKLLLELYENSCRSHKSTCLMILLFLQIVNFMGWILTSYFIHGVKSMILYGCFANWYWSLNKNQVPKNTAQYFTTSVRKFHLGTVTTGIILMAGCDLINVSLVILVKQVFEINNWNLILLSFACCFQSFFTPINYVNRNAMMLATHGTDFYISGKKAFKLLIVRNIGKVLVITQVSSLIFLFGALISIGIPWLITFSIPTREVDDYTNVSLLVAFMLFNSISDLLQISVDTILIFICILKKIDRNDFQEQPYHLSDKLEKLLEKF